jgi:hypothetical protein
MVECDVSLSALLLVASGGRVGLTDGERLMCNLVQVFEIETATTYKNGHHIHLFLLTYSVWI